MQADSHHLSFVKIAFASYVLQASMLNLFCISDNRLREQVPILVYYEYDDGYIGKLNVSSIGIYAGFCVVIQFLKSCRKFLFLDLHQLRLLGSQQHSQSGVLLTSFSTRGTENNLAEINLEITGGVKGL